MPTKPDLSGLGLGAAAGHSLLVLATLAALLLACSAPSTSTGPAVRAENVWSRPAQTTAGMADQAGQSPMEMDRAMAATSGSNSAVYMLLVNDGQSPDRLAGAAAGVSQVVEIHETTMDGDVMKMQQVEGGIEIPAGGQVELKPGGYHIMLIGVTRDLNPGDTFPVTLTLEKAGTLTVEAEVREP